MFVRDDGSGSGQRRGSIFGVAAAAGAGLRHGRLDGVISHCKIAGGRIRSISAVTSGLLCLGEAGELLVWRRQLDEKEGTMAAGMEPHPRTRWLELEDREQVALVASSGDVVALVTRCHDGSNRVGTFFDGAEDSTEQVTADRDPQKLVYHSIDMKLKRLPEEAGSIVQLVASGTLAAMLTSTGAVFYTGCPLEARTPPKPQKNKLRAPAAELARLKVGDFVRLKSDDSSVALQSCSKVLHLNTRAVARIVGHDHASETWLVKPLGPVAEAETDDAPTVEAAMAEGQLACHEGVTCNCCGMAPIMGVRHKRGVNYNLCSHCYMARDREREIEQGLPPRACTAFMFYSIERRPHLKAENPDWSFGEFGKAIGAEWREMGDGDKAAYTQQAEKDQVRYASDMEKFTTITVPQMPTPGFDPAATFSGQRAGCVYKTGDRGLGYYAETGESSTAGAEKMPQMLVSSVSSKHSVTGRNIAMDLLSSDLAQGWAPKFRFELDRQSQRRLKDANLVPGTKPVRQLRKHRAGLPTEWVQITLPKGSVFKKISIVTARIDEPTVPRTVELCMGRDAAQISPGPSGRTQHTINLGPMDAGTFYSLERRPIMEAERPDWPYHNYAAAVSAEWAQMSAEQKAPFEQASLKDQGSSGELPTTPGRFITTTLFSAAENPGVICTSRVAKLAIPPGDPEKTGAIRRIVLELQDDIAWRMEDCVLLTAPSSPTLGRVVKMDAGFALVSRTQPEPGPESEPQPEFAAAGTAGELLDQCEIYPVADLVVSNAEEGAPLAVAGSETLQQVCQSVFDACLKATPVGPVQLPIRMHHKNQKELLKDPEAPKRQHTTVIDNEHDTMSEKQKAMAEADKIRFQAEMQAYEATGGSVCGIALHCGKLVTVAIGPPAELIGGAESDGQEILELRCTRRWLNCVGAQDPGPANDEGAPAAPSQHVSYKQLHYCARRLGRAAIPGSNGACGPTNGPQCASCERYTAARDLFNEQVKRNAAEEWIDKVIWPTAIARPVPGSFCVAMSTTMGDVVFLPGAGSKILGLKPSFTPPSHFVPPLRLLATAQESGGGGLPKTSVHKCPSETVAMVYAGTPLLDAARAHDLDALVRLLQDAASWNLTDQFGRGMLHLADVGLLQKLLAHLPVMLIQAQEAGLGLMAMLRQMNENGQTPIAAAAQRDDFAAVSMLIEIAETIQKDLAAYFLSTPAPGQLFSLIAGRSFPPSPPESFWHRGALRIGSIVRVKSTVEIPKYGWAGVATPYSVGTITQMSGDAADVTCMDRRLVSWKAAKADLECCAHDSIRLHSSLFEADLSKHSLQSWSNPSTPYALAEKLKQKTSNGPRGPHGTARLAHAERILSQALPSGGRMVFDTPIPFSVARKVNLVLYDEDIRQASSLGAYAAAVGCGEDFSQQDVPLAILMGEEMFAVALSRRYRTVATQKILSAACNQPDLMRCCFCAPDCLFLHLVDQRDCQAVNAMLDAISIHIRDAEAADEAAVAERAIFAEAAVKNLMHLLSTGVRMDETKALHSKLINIIDSTPETFAQLDSSGRSVLHHCWEQADLDTFTQIVGALTDFWQHSAAKAIIVALLIFRRDIIRDNAGMIIPALSFPADHPMRARKPLLHMMVSGIRHDTTAQHRFYVLTKQEMQAVDCAVQFIQKAIPDVLGYPDKDGSTPVITAIACFQYNAAISVLRAEQSVESSPGRPNLVRTESSPNLSGTDKDGSSALVHLIRNARKEPPLDEGSGLPCPSPGGGLCLVQDSSNDERFEELVAFYCQRTDLASMAGKVLAGKGLPLQLLLRLKGGEESKVQQMFHELLTFDNIHAALSGSDRGVVAATLLSGAAEQRGPTSTAPELVQAVLDTIARAAGRDTAEEVLPSTGIGRAGRTHAVSLRCGVGASGWKVVIGARPKLPPQAEIEEVAHMLVDAAIKVRSIVAARNSQGTANHDARSGTVLRNIRRVFQVHPRPGWWHLSFIAIPTATR